MSSTDSSLEPTLQYLRQVRLSILRLHKALLHSERVVYEQEYGAIRSNNEFLQLVIGHDWFSWLRPISQFIVQMDDFILSKDPVTLEQADELLQQAQNLMQPAEEGTQLGQKYYQAIQRDPDIALMHADLSQLFQSQRS
ncbi:MAG: hypothetical protein KME16_04685 [Scytolyngbya sp. HA4215-MV1]|jgi:hypothetical protein|nr:hypothetical protein [Scytolyngbya sp. HA4215-MV1]